MSGIYESSFGAIRIDRAVADLVKCTCARRSGCDGCRLEIGLDRFAELLYRLGWQLGAVSEAGFHVDKLPPPAPWKPAPWQQVFPGPLPIAQNVLPPQRECDLTTDKKCVMVDNCPDGCILR